MLRVQRIQFYTVLVSVEHITASYDCHCIFIDGVCGFFFDLLRGLLTSDMRTLIFMKSFIEGFCNWRVAS